MGLLMADELFDAQAVRAMAHSVHGGADIGECVANAARIRKTDAVLLVFIGSIVNARVMLVEIRR